MSEPLQITLDAEGRVILEVTPALAEILREALSVAKEEGGVLKADLSHFGALVLGYARVEDSACVPSGQVVFSFVRRGEAPLPAAALEAGKTRSTQKDSAAAKGGEGRSQDERGSR